MAEEEKESPIEQIQAKLNGTAPYLYNSTQTQRANSNATQEQSSASNTTQTTENILPFDETGNFSGDAKARYERELGDLDRRYHRIKSDDGTTAFDWNNMSLRNALGIPDELQDELDKERLERNERKRRAGNFYNSASVLGDILLAGIGKGGVYRREAYKGAEEALKDNEKLKQEALDRKKAADKAKMAYEEKYYQDLDALKKSIINDFTKKKASSEGKNESKGESKTESSSNTTTQYEGNGMSPGGSRGNGKTTENEVWKIPVKTGKKTDDGKDIETTIDITLTPKQAETIGALLSAKLRELSSEDQSTVKATLDNFGIKPITKMGEDGQEYTTYRWQDLLRSGVMFNNENIWQIAREAMKSNGLSDDEIATIQDALVKQETNYKPHSGFWFWQKPRENYSTMPIKTDNSVPTDVSQQTGGLYN